MHRLPHHDPWVKYQSGVSQIEVKGLGRDLTESPDGAARIQ